MHLQKHTVSNNALIAHYTRKLILSHSFWIFLPTFIFVFVEVNAGTLFGASFSEPLIYQFGFSPAVPLRNSGVPFLTYGLLHQSWNHWLGSVFLFLLLATWLERRTPGEGIGKQFLLLLGYAVISALIATTFLNPFAPLTTPADRIFGISGIVMFQLGLLLWLKPPICAWVLVPILGLYYFFDPSRPEVLTLAQWGHGVGFLIGLVMGCGLKFRSCFLESSRSNEASS